MTSHRKKVAEATTNAANEPSLSEQLHRSAYNYYSASQVESGDANFVKRSRQLLAAALLTSSSMIAMGVMPSTARAADPGTFACTTSAATPIDCTGTSSTRRLVAHANAFTTTINFDDETLIDTSGDVAASAGSDIGLSVYGYNHDTRVYHYGSITTGEIDGGGGIKGGQHGIYGGANNSQMRLHNYGTIDTEVEESHGLYSHSRNSSAHASNGGTITTLGDQSHGVVAVSDTDKAHASNFGIIILSGDRSMGVVSILTAPNSLSDTASATNDGTIYANGDYNVGVSADAAGTIASGKTRDDSEIDLTGDNSIGLLVSAGTTARAYSSGTINVDGGGNSAGILVTGADEGVALAMADGTIELRGEDAEGPDVNIGIAVLGQTAYATLTEDNIIRSSGDQSAIGVIAGTQAKVAQVYHNVVTLDSTYTLVENSGLIDLSANTDEIENIGISVNADTVVVGNYGTVTAEGYSSIGVAAVGDVVDITNGEDATISGGDVAISVDFVMSATINNAGTINGGVRGRSADEVSTAEITNTGVINGVVQLVDFSDDSKNADADVTFTNEGGTVGDGYSAFVGGNGIDIVTITGTGNVINGVLHDRESTGGVLTFAQSDELVLNIASKGAAIFGFDEINFDDGTTIFGEDVSWLPGGEDSALTINAGATMGVVDDHSLEVFTHQAIVRGGDGVRGTLSVPAGSFIDFDGNLTFAEGGRFLVGVAGDRDYGSLGAYTMTFDEGSEVYVDVTRNIELTDGGEMQIARAIGGMIDNGVSVYDNTALFDFDYELRDGINFYLIVDHVLTALDTTTDASGSSNARNVAAAIDQFIESVPSDNPIVVYLTQFPVEEQQAALFQLVKDSLPTESGAEGSATTTSTDAVIDLIMDRLSGGTTLADNGFGQGVAAGEQLLGGDGNWALWGRAGASFAKFTPSGVNGFDADTYAISLGIDGDVAPDIRLGVVGFYTSTDVDENGAGANSDQTIDGYGGFLYGSWTPNNSFVNVALGYQLNDYESHRVAAGSIHTAEFDGDQLMGSVEVGQIFDYGKWKVTPHVGLRANRVKLDGYTETGPVPISMSGQTITSVRGVLGVGATYSFDFDNGQKLTPEAYVRVIEELGNPNQSVTGTVVGGGTFVSQSTNRKDLTYAAGAGLRYTMSDTTSIRLLYDGQYQSDYREHAISIAARFNF